MNIKIREATEKDFASILTLVKELAEFQHAIEKVSNTVEQMREDKDLFRCLVAENDQKEIVGIASYFFAYFTWVGKSLCLDDLVVRRSWRGQKVGSKLLQQIFEVAKTEDCKRVRWLVSAWNKPALEFYKKCGAEIDNESCICDFDAKGIAEFRL